MKDIVRSVGPHNAAGVTAHTWASATSYSHVLSPDQELVAFLSDPGSYPGKHEKVDVIETHMSLVFMPGSRVYKMKKPLHLGLVEFTTLDQRKKNCEREVTLNQQLAPGVYRKIVPVVRMSDGRLSLDGRGEPVEWLVVMKRLDQRRLLHHRILHSDVTTADIDRLTEILIKFYAAAPVVQLSGLDLLAWWHDMVQRTSRSLLDPLFVLPSDQVGRVTKALAKFLEDGPELISARAISHRIIDGHGDLRPEHIYIGSKILLIDRLEFDPKLRWIDPFDELLFLALECDRLGASWIGPRIMRAMEAGLADHPPPGLMQFYRCFRAALRAALSIEHMRDPRPRTPERWTRQACEYLSLALATLPIVHQS